MTSRYAPTRLDHVGILVPSLDEAIAFYTTVFDWVVVSRHPARALHYQGMDVAFLSCSGGAMLELIGPAVSASYDHRGEVFRPYHLAVVVDSLSTLEAKCHHWGIMTSRASELNGRLMSLQLLAPDGTSIEAFEPAARLVSASGMDSHESD